MKDELKTKLHIKTDIDAFGRRRASVSNHRPTRSYSVVISSLIAIVVGVSVPYFIIDAGTKAYKHVSARYAGAHGITDTVDKDSTDGVALGSDDADNVPIPEGNNVLVNSGSNVASGQYYFQSPDYKVPNVNGSAYVVGDVDTGEIILEKNPEMVLPIASISKLVTAIVAKDYMNQHEMVSVSRTSVEMYGTFGRLSNGEKILITDLYYPLIMESSNDAAEVFAESFGYDGFINLMNSKVKEFGMRNTSFEEPSGLSEKNVSTARDLFKLAENITKTYPEIWDISRVRQYSILRHAWTNGSVLARRSDFIGGKNGFTYEADHTTVVVLNLPMEGGPRRIAITLLKSSDRERDVDALARFVSKWVGFLPAGQSLNEDN